MDPLLTDRILTELDNHSGTIEQISKITHTTAATSAINMKLTLVIIFFLITTSLTIIVVKLQENHGHSNTPLIHKKTDIVQKEQSKNVKGKL